MFFVVDVTATTNLLALVIQIENKPGAEISI